MAKAKRKHAEKETMTERAKRLGVPLKNYKAYKAACRKAAKEHLG